jgi:shikimate kinase
MTGRPLIYLVGYRGSGKTTVGKALGAKLGWAFVDADALLEQRAGQTIREIFAAEGEAGFRDREAAILQELSQSSRTVVATGGGVILREENRDCLTRSGFVAWLSADAATLWPRIQGDASTAARRPNLTVGGLAEVEHLLAVREPLYRRVADLEIPVAELSPEQAADAILAAWTSPSPKPSGSSSSSSSASSSGAS